MVPAPLLRLPMESESHVSISPTLLGLPLKREQISHLRSWCSDLDYVEQTSQGGRRDLNP